MQMNKSKQNTCKEDLLIDFTSTIFKIKQGINDFGLMPILSELPHDSILVGGFIRDLILEKSHGCPDIDIVVPDNSFQIGLKLADKFNGKLIVIDKERNIVRVIFEKFVFDIASRIGNSIFDDLKSRDFTINSIAFELDSSMILDPCNGVSDLRNSYLRTFNNQNLLDDPLRMLRCFRFLAVFNFNIDKELLQFIKLNKHHLQNISGERINYEIRLIINSANALKAVFLIKEFHLFGWLQLNKQYSCKRLKAINFKFLNRQEANLFLPIFYLSEIFDEFAMKKLKFSKKEILNNKYLHKWKSKIFKKSIKQFNENEIFQLHKELEDILPAFILYLPFSLQFNWLERWRDTKDKLFHPISFLNGHTLKNFIDIEDGPLLGGVIEYLSRECAYDRLSDFDEAIFKAKQWIQQNAPKYD
tara:strand:+ start:14394 stop:15641 length:1248 start_codon:yes stop_codon:yes gene_type:complete